MFERDLKQTFRANLTIDIRVNMLKNIYLIIQDEYTNYKTKPHHI